MPFTGVAHPEQLAILTEALDAYCKTARIEPGSPARDDAARLIMSLFTSGAVTADELKTALQDRPHPPRI